VERCLRLAPTGHFSLFLEAVSGKNIPIQNENFSDLSQLCDEFSFWSLSSKISAFRDSPEHAIWFLKGRVSELEQAHAALRAAAQKPLQGSFRDLKAKQTEQEQQIADLRRDLQKKGSVVEEGPRPAPQFSPPVQPSDGVPQPPSADSLPPVGSSAPEQ
jgi:hypothetical protein